MLCSGISWTAAPPACCLACPMASAPPCCVHCAGGSRTTTINTAPPGRMPWEVLDVDDDAPYVSAHLRGMLVGLLRCLHAKGPASAPHPPHPPPLTLAPSPPPPHLHCPHRTSLTPPTPGPLPRSQVNWGVDLTEGKATDPWKNAQLSSATKDTMWELHSKEG